ncbi:RNA polymerase sigma factor [Bacteroidota bacterium]
MTVEEFKIKVIPVNSKLYKFAIRFLFIREEAEDAVQEVFIKLWELRNDLENIENIEAYAMRMTRNLCIDKIKAKKTVSIETQNYNNKLFQLEDGPENKLILKETVEKVGRIINELPENQKTIIELRDRDGYSFEEISKIMKMSAVNVRVCLSRARRKVKEILNKTYDYGSGTDTNIAGKIL